MAKKAVFLDRDNTIIDDPGYLVDPGAVKLLPGADLLVALTILGEGRVPAPVGAAPVVGALLLVTAGLALARPGLASWRHGR